MTKFYVILFEICVEVVDNRRNIYTDRYEQQIEIRNLLPGHFLPIFRDTRDHQQLFCLFTQPLFTAATTSELQTQYHRHQDPVTKYISDHVMQCQNGKMHQFCASETF